MGLRSKDAADAPLFSVPKALFSVCAAVRLVRPRTGRGLTAKTRSISMGAAPFWANHGFSLPRVPVPRLRYALARTEEQGRSERGSPARRPRLTRAGCGWRKSWWAVGSRAGIHSQHRFVRSGACSLHVPSSPVKQSNSTRPKSPTPHRAACTTWLSVSERRWPALRPRFPAVSMP